MKRIQKNMIVILVIIFTVIATTINVKSADVKHSEDCKVYDVKDKKDVIINIYNFYEEGKEELYQKIEERRIEEEKRLEEERLQQEREEQERLEIERQRQAYLRQQEMLAARNTNIQMTGDVVSYAKQFVGYPYVGGGTTLEGGTDCSGFVALVYQKFGVNLPRTTSGQANSGYAVSVDAIQPGDIISYGYNGYVTHSALYIGDGLMIHSSTPELGVRIDNMYILPIITIRRVA